MHIRIHKHIRRISPHEEADAAEEQTTKKKKNHVEEK